jgi:hypothetical protein
VCEQHLSSVVLAATGDRRAASMLQAGSGRCRACAREAHGLRAVLNERLAVAPWPLVIKPAGVLAAKVGAVTAIFGGKSAGGAGAVAIGSSSGAGAAATVIAAAALATGATALVEDGNAVRHATPQAASAQHVSKRAAGRQVRSQHAAAAPSRSHRPAARHAVTAKPATAKLHAKVTATKPRTVRPPVRSTTTTASAPTTAGTQSAAAPSAPTAPTLTNTVDSTVTKVREGVKNVTDKVLPKTLADPVDTTLQGVQDTVKGVTGTVDQLLKPKP